MSVNYVDDVVKKEVESAVEKAAANLMVDGLTVSKEEKEKLKQQLLNDYKISLLIKKRKGLNANR